MKLSDIKGERAIEVIADLIEPISNIANDKDCADVFTVKAVKGEKAEVTAKKHLIKKVPVLLKNHKADVIKIIAILDGKDASEMTVFGIVGFLINVIKDEALIELFTSAARSVEETPPIDTCTKQGE